MGKPEGERFSTESFFLLGKRDRQIRRFCFQSQGPEPETAKDFRIIPKNQAERPLAHTPKRWIMKASGQADPEMLARQLDISPILSRILTARGLSDPQSCKRFLEPSLTQLHSPDSMPDLALATGILLEACQKKLPICIYGDYDADGCTGTAILFRTLKLLGAEVFFYIPHRLSQGYGLHVSAVEEIAGLGAKILVTVDCGITAIEPTLVAKSKGIRVIITDHHEFGPTLPEADAILHPRLPGKEAPFGHLSGSAVAFKLAWGLIVASGGTGKVPDSLRAHVRNCMAIAALGVIADVVPLVDENRIIAKFGLKHLLKMDWPGIVHLLEVADLTGNKTLQSDDIGYKLGPRLNVLGRFGCARLVVELLTTDQAGKARQLAEVIDTYNKQRQSLERKMVEEARLEVEKTGQMEAPGLVVYQKDWSPGLVGIIASRLVDHYGKPALVLGGGTENTPQEGLAVGSGRTVSPVHLNKVLDKCRDLIDSGGGHAAAVGLKLAWDKLEQLKERFHSAVLEETGGKPITPTLRLESEVPLLGLGVPLVRTLETLEPFGAGNPRPIYLVSDATIEGDPRLVGKDGNTILVTIRQGEAKMKAVGFHMGSRKEEMLSGGGKISIAFVPMINEFQGRTSVDLQIKDFQPKSDPLIEWETESQSWEATFKER